MYLEKFSEEQQSLLVELPYRVGLWVSATDSTGGHEADAVEKQALEQVIVAYAEDFCKSEFVERIMRETVARRESWPQWNTKLDNVPDECRQAVAIVSEKLEVRDVGSFKHNLMEIAVDVAMAFREIDYSEDLAAKISAYGRYYWGQLVAKVKSIQPPSLEDTLNISPAERAALKELEQALRIDEKDGLVPEPKVASEAESFGPADEAVEVDDNHQEDSQTKLNVDNLIS